jgi:hypothetical protein
MSYRLSALVPGAGRLARWRTGALIVSALMLLPAAAAQASAYENPFTADSVVVGRTDMGVDACLAAGDPIRAVGGGVVVGVIPNWYEHQPYIWYELTSGPDAGRYVYVAEQIDHLAKVGQTLSAGDVVARFAATGTCIETGWSTASGETTAAATTGYSEGEVTDAGVSFAHFLISIGVPGQFELTPTRTATNTATKAGGKAAPKTTPKRVPKPVAKAAPKAQAHPATARRRRRAAAPAKPKPAKHAPPQRSVTSASASGSTGGTAVGGTASKTTSVSKPSSSSTASSPSTPPAAKTGSGSDGAGAWWDQPASPFPS